LQDTINVFEAILKTIHYGDFPLGSVLYGTAKETTSVSCLVANNKGHLKGAPGNASTSRRRFATC